MVFSGRQMMTMAPCGVNDIIEKTLEREELAPAGDFKIETRLEPGLPGIMADAGQLEAALVNLLVNAREAMAGGGTAVITSAALRLEGGEVKSPDTAQAGTLFIKIAVRDSGEGIGAEVFERLFEPLFSTRKKRQGAGLGLALVYGVVHQQNGWVEVKSEPGQGSEFIIFLPAVNKPAEV